MATTSSQTLWRSARSAHFVLQAQVIQGSGARGQGGSSPGVVYDLFSFLCVFCWVTAVRDIELQLCKDTCYVKLLVLCFLLCCFFVVKESKLQKNCEPRIGQALHILGKQCFNTFSQGFKSRALEIAIQFLFTLTAGFQKKSTKPGEHVLVCAQTGIQQRLPDSPLMVIYMLGAIRVTSKCTHKTNIASVFSEFMSNQKDQGMVLKRSEVGFLLPCY